MTGLCYKTLPSNIGDAAFVALNMDNSTPYSVSLNYNELPLSKNSNNPSSCTEFDIWSKKSATASSFKYALPLTHCVTWTACSFKSPQLIVKMKITFDDRGYHIIAENCSTSNKIQTCRPCYHDKIDKLM